MIFAATPLTGAFVIEPELLEDERGFFARSFCFDEFETRGLNPRVVQCNISFNGSRGALRGLHYQRRPHREAKLVRCTAGALYDVIVDLQRYLEVIAVVEDNRRYYNTNPKCEPQLGRRGLYRALGGVPDLERAQMALLWVLNLSDGKHSLLDIATRADVDFATIRSAAELLRANGLLAEASGPAAEEIPLDRQRSTGE